MRQLVILSGKGGTGKTTVTASFAALAKGCVVADCDVDAADLHLVLNPEVHETHVFEAMPTAFIDKELCVSCGDCVKYCRYSAISDNFVVDRLSCEGCRLCMEICPAHAIRLEKDTTGRWYVSETKYGPMVHARLGVAQENSGKLVATVREKAREIAEKRALNWVIIDGPPGMGCPVISTLSGTDLALIVVEPTVSGIHDMERVVGVARHFRVPVACAVNKWDINPENTEKVEAWCQEEGIPVLGRIGFDRKVTEAAVHGLPVVEYIQDGPAVELRSLWTEVRNLMNENGERQ